MLRDDTKGDNGINNFSVVGVPRRGIFVFLLLIVLVSALELPEWLVLISDAPIPWFDKSLPYLAPFIVAVLIFNMAVNRRIAPLSVLAHPELFFLILFLFAVFGVELGHLALGTGDLNSGLLFGYLWFVVFVIALVSFHQYLPDCPNLVVRVSILLSIVACFLVLLAQLLSPTWGIALPGLKSPQLFDSAQGAYTAVFGITLLLFYFRWNTTKALTISVVGFCVFLSMVFTQRILGPQLLLTGIIGLKVLGVIGDYRSQLKIIMLVILACGVWITSLVWHTQQSPTLVGVFGTSFYYDEIGFVHGDLISGFARRGTLFQGIYLFLEAPIFGVGMSRTTEVHSLIYGIHSNIVYLLSATGLFGVALFVTPLILPTTRAFRQDGLRALALPLIVVGAMLLMPKVSMWWSIALYLIVIRSKSRRLTEHKF